MTDPNEKEIQKTLDEMKKRAEEFQAEKMYTTESSFSSFSNSKLKLILTIMGVVVVLVVAVFFYIKSSSPKTQIKPPAEMLERMKQMRLNQQNNN